MGERYNGKFFRVDLETSIAYNIYIIIGLSLGAIATSGADSLKVVAYSVKTSYFYFVVDGKGGYTFNINFVSYNKFV